MSFLLALFTTLLALYNTWGVVTGVQQAAYLSTLPLRVPLAYLIGREVVWVVVWAVVSLGLWWRQQWAWWVVWAAFPLYLLHAWFDRLVLAQQPVPNWPFLLAFDAVQCGLLFFSLWWTRPRSPRVHENV